MLLARNQSAQLFVAQVAQLRKKQAPRDHTIPIAAPGLCSTSTGIVPSSGPVCIRKRDGPIRVSCKVPLGTMRGIRLTEEREKFLVEQGMNPELIEKGCVFDASDAFVSNFDKEREAFISLAERCGLSPDDLNKIQEAIRGLPHLISQTTQSGWLNDDQLRPPDLSGLGPACRSCNPLD